MKDGETEPKEYISQIEVEISENYTKAVYESCRNVIIPATGGLAMDLACGQFNSKTCTAERFLCIRFLTDIDNNRIFLIFVFKI